MIKVEKQVKVIIDEEDVDALRDVCELTRRMVGHGSVSIEYSEKQIYKIKRFINYIFDNT